jgi:hypothetical protein
MKFSFPRFKGFGHALRHRYGRAGGPKRDEGVQVVREPKRLYYVDGRGHVMSAPMHRK